MSPWATMRSRRRPRKSSSVCQPSVGVRSRNCSSPDSSSLNHVRADRVIEHRGGADLHRAASEQEIVQRVREFGDAADAGKAPVGKRGGHLRHLRERQRQDRRSAEAAVRDLPLDVHLELERLGIDQRQRRERVRRGNRVGAGLERRLRFLGDVRRRRRELHPHRHARRLPSRHGRPCRSARSSCRCWSPCPRDPCAGTRGSAPRRRRPAPDRPSASVCQ